MSILAQVNTAIANYNRFVEQQVEAARRDERFRRQLDVNVTGVFLCCQRLGSVMAERGRGSIINVASTAYPTTQLTVAPVSFTTFPHFSSSERM